MAALKGAHVNGGGGLIPRLRDLLEKSEQRKARARGREERDKGENWCLGLLGLKSDLNEYTFKHSVLFRSVEEPPSEFDLMTALKNKSLIGAIGRYSSGFEYELVIPRKSGSFGESLIDMGWTIISALRVITLADFLVPAAADRSWSVISGAPDNSCVVALIEDVPNAFSFGDKVIVKQSHFDWVSSNLDEFSRQGRDVRFLMAAEALAVHQHQSSLRFSTATLWSGIEALFGFNTELRFRLASIIAAYLENGSAERLVLYETIKKEYDRRSKAIHGSPISDSELTKHIIWARSMLSRLLVKIVENKKFPEQLDLEKILFA